MARLIIVRGISGSGKSTWARNYRDTNKDVVVVNRDSIRALLFGSEEAYGVNERLVTNVQDVVIDGALSHNYTVVVDNTNIVWDFVLNLQTIGLAHGVQAELFVLRTPLSVALGRNAGRERKVPEHVIRNQWEKLQETIDWEL